ncbi:MAG: hypothetical protein DHS20C04_19290 [Hyphococcus sp.]|nr:MAG: hypothetical protein DHS20C04_19290 [Marinicaulis sp.]
MQPPVQDELMQRHAGHIAKNTQKVIPAHRGALRQHFECEIRSGVMFNASNRF